MNKNDTDLKHYDVAIIGAGIGGLVLGEQLSKNFSVLILEQNSTPNYRTWITDYTVLKNEYGEEYVAKDFKHSFLASEKRKITIKDNFVAADGKKLTHDLAKKISANGGKILFDTEFMSCKNRQQQIYVVTSGGGLTCNLLIDCSGHRSKLAKKYGVYGKRLFHNVYAKTFQTKLDDDENNLLSVYTGDKQERPYYFEIVPSSKGESVTYTFTTTKKPADYKELGRANKRNVRKGKSIDNIELKRAKEQFGGAIPLFNPKKVCVDNIFFFGDSAGWAPALTGAGFSAIIRDGRRIASHLANCLEERKLDEISLTPERSERQIINDGPQLMLSYALYSINVKDFHTLIVFLENIPDSIIYNMFYGNITRNQLDYLLKACFTDMYIVRIMFKVLIRNFTSLAPQGIKFIKLLKTRKSESLKPAS